MLPLYGKGGSEASLLLLLLPLLRSRLRSLPLSLWPLRGDRLRSDVRFPPLPFLSRSRLLSLPSLVLSRPRSRLLLPPPSLSLSLLLLFPLR